jgi:hypothetical protein
MLQTPSIDPTEPLITFFRDNPDYNLGDIEKEAEALFDRQKMIDLVVAGSTPVDELMDCLKDQGFDTDDYIDQICENIEIIIDNDLGRFIDPLDREFFLQ